MSWVIAVLLGLILVAMVSSNSAAAAGVWKVVRFALIGFVLLIAWAIFIGSAVWFFETYSKGEWERIIGIALAVLVPPILLWTTRKAIADIYKEDKKTAFKSLAVIVAFIAAFLVVAVVVREIQATYEYGGWFLVVVPLVATGIILLWRSLTGPQGWKEVWCGLPLLPDPSPFIEDERYAAESAESAAWEQTTANWDDLTAKQQDDLRQERRARWVATEERLKALATKLQNEKAVREKENGWSVMGAFWLFLVFATFGLIGIVWDLGFAYAMGLKFVRGQSWLAGGLIVIAIIGMGAGIAGLVDSILERTGTRKLAREDERMFWELQRRGTAIRAKYDPSHSWHEATTVPDAYTAEIKQLNLEYRGVLQRRNGWTDRDFSNYDN